MTEKQKLKTYVESLPKIYRDILAAFPRLEPTRKKGFGLAFQTLAIDFTERESDTSMAEIVLACKELKKHGIVSIKRNMFVEPTDLGESLIEAITGKRATAVSVPKIPAPPVQ